ncbi:MAG: ATP-binding cassette domain-containing protein, partial [Thermotogota bacterium]
MSSSAEVMLQIQDMSINYGPINAVNQISIQVPAGKIVTLIGANGAGQSSTLAGISGLVRVKHGTVKFREEP